MFISYLFKHVKRFFKICLNKFMFFLELLERAFYNKRQDKG